MKTKHEILCDVDKVIRKITSKEVVLDLSTPLLGKSNLIDSLTIIELITWSNDYYKINVMEDDIKLEGLKTIGSFVDKIYDLQK